MPLYLTERRLSRRIGMSLLTMLISDFLLQIWNEIPKRGTKFADLEQF